MRRSLKEAKVIHMNESTIINIGAIIQEELDKRIGNLRDTAEMLPFDGPIVINWRDINIVTNEFTFNIMNKIRALNNR